MEKRFLKYRGNVIDLKYVYKITDIYYSNLRYMFSVCYKNKDSDLYTISSDLNIFDKNYFLFMDKSPGTYRFRDYDKFVDEHNNIVGHWLHYNESEMVDIDGSN